MQATLGAGAVEEEEVVNPSSFRYIPNLIEIVNRDQLLRKL